MRLLKKKLCIVRIFFFCGEIMSGWKRGDRCNGRHDQQAPKICNFTLKNILVLIEMVRIETKDKTDKFSFNNEYNQNRDGSSTNMNNLKRQRNKQQS